MKVYLSFAICFVVGWDEGVAQVIKNEMFLVILHNLANVHSLDEFSDVIFESKQNFV